MQGHAAKHSSTAGREKQAESATACLAAWPKIGTVSRQTGLSHQVRRIAAKHSGTADHEKQVWITAQRSGTADRKKQVRIAAQRSGTADFKTQVPPLTGAYSRSRFRKASSFTMRRLARLRCTVMTRGRGLPG